VSRKRLYPDVLAKWRAMNDQLEAALAQAEEPLTVTYLEDGKRVSEPINKEQIVVVDPERKTPSRRPIALVRRRSTPRPREAAPSRASRRGGDSGDKPRLAGEDDEPEPPDHLARGRQGAR
jgi:hypothetical protein